LSIIIAWIVFLWLDKLWNEVMAQAVSEKTGTYGELYGPLSFFRPAVLYLALILTLFLVIINIMEKIRSYKNEYQHQQSDPGL
ncbi:MAG: hypothetical protein ACO3BO_06985, partial [Anaerohalosphaeraceae bacterium]